MGKTDTDTLGARVRQTRQNLRLSTQEVADRVNARMPRALSAKKLEQFEGGLRGVNTNIIPILADVLGVTPLYIYTGQAPQSGTVSLRRLNDHQKRTVLDVIALIEGTSKAEKPPMTRPRKVKGGGTCIPDDEEVAS